MLVVSILESVSISDRMLETLIRRQARMADNTDYAAEPCNVHAQQTLLIDYSIGDLNMFQVYHARFSKISSTTFAVAFTISSCSRE